MGCGSSVASAAAVDDPTVRPRTDITLTKEPPESAEYGGTQPQTARSSDKQMLYAEYNSGYDTTRSSAESEADQDAHHVPFAQRTFSTPSYNSYPGFSEYRRVSVHRMQSWGTQPRRPSVPGAAPYSPTRIMITSATPTSLSPRSQTSYDSAQ